MKFIPILFSTPMVQAINEGRKTMTRREIKPKDQPYFKHENSKIEYSESFGWVVKHQIEGDPARFEITQHFKCPHGKKGDVLWVREKWRKYYHVDEAGYTHFDQEIIEYASDKPPMITEVDGDGFRMYNKNGSEKFIPWRPSIFMPKAACRIFLEITNIIVERLQDISEMDSIAEGVIKETSFEYKNYFNDGIPKLNAKSSFQTLWKSINGEDSWDDNPYVWVIEFKRIEKPENFN